MDQESIKSLKTIGQVSLPKVSPKQLPIAAKIRGQYGDASQFLVTFNKDIQLKVARNIERAHLGTAPTLAQTALAYSQEIVNNWIYTQLEDLNRFTGVSEKINKQQALEVGAMMANEYPYFKVTEIQLFFYRIKSGVYGTFYGSVDAIKIMNALHQFANERRQAIHQFQNEKRELEMITKRKEWASTGVSREEYERTKNLKDSI